MPASLGSSSTRPVASKIFDALPVVPSAAAKFKRAADRNNVGYSCLAHRDRIIACEFLTGLAQEFGGRPAFPAEQTMNCRGAQIALLSFVAEQGRAAAPSQQKSSA